MARRWLQAVVGVGAVAAMALGAVGAGAIPALAQHAQSANPYGFDGPDAVALSGGDLFVANRAGNSVTVISTASGALVATISGSRIEAPDAMLVAGGHLFIADRRANAVTELALPSRKVVRVVTGLAAPVALATDCEKSLFVLSSSGVVSRVALATGRRTGRVSGPALRSDHPTAMAYASGHLFVTNAGSSSVTEIAASTMKPVRVLSSGYGFDHPVGLAVLSGKVWVTNQSGQSLDELSGATGALLQAVPDIDGYLPSPGPIATGDGDVYVASPPGGSPMITRVIPTKPAQAPWMMCNTNGPYTFSNPAALVVDGAHLWVANQGSTAPGVPAGNSVTEMDAVSGALVRVLR